MSEAPGVESILSQAVELEQDYDWLGAVESYKKSLDLVPEHDFSRKGEIYERLGYAFHRAAMQAESVNEFRTRCAEAVENYEKAREFYEKLNGGPEKAPRMLRCDAMISYVGYWLASEASEKKRLLDECWRLTKEALKAFEEAGNAWEYGKTYNQLAQSALLGYYLEWDFQAREKTLREAMKHGEQAIAFLSTFDDRYELARAYVKTAAFFEQLGLYFVDIDEKERYYQKVLGYWEKANELSEETAHIELLNSFIEQEESLGWGTGTDRAVENLKKALEYGKKTKDRLIVGYGLDDLAYHTSFAKATEDLDERAELLKLALEYAEDARKQYSQVSFKSPRSGAFIVELSHVEYYLLLAQYETNLRKKGDLLEKAMAAAPECLKRAEDSGYPSTIGNANRLFSGILTQLAKIEANSDEKKRLLEKALKLRNESVRLTDQFEPFVYWNRGTEKTGLANIKSELADLAKDPENKKSMLQEAILDKENSLKLCIKHLAFWESKGELPILYAALGLRQSIYGDLLKHYYELTNSQEHLRKAVEAYKEATESYQKLNQTSRMAECHWKAAQAYDALGEHLKAAESFDLASDNYKGAAEKIPQLKDFYKDHASYMQAWSEIEKARHHHEKQEYSTAKEHFEKAANIHKTLKQWSYLTSNYSAWAQVEHAEDLSRREQSEEALQAFEQATNLFNETKKSIQTELSTIETLDEKQMATNMLKATNLRHEYCTARIAIEEAKILDKKGDHYSSSKKYSSAAETLKKIAQALESEQDRRETKYLINLSQAWQKMTQAEAEASPTLYVEASQLFEEAKEHTLNEKTKMLVLGHSRFCRALEAGAKFADTRDSGIHTVAVQHLESAANYYVEAGFQNVSEYAKATKMLFDAYLYMDNAQKETDPEKKAKLYKMAETVLQASAGAYMKAGHPEKREKVLRLLEKVKEERELAVSLTEVLHAPPVVSTTTFSAPTPTYEKAIGLEKFEHADIQANIIARQRELKVGENLDLEIELVNAGKGPALLTKITNVIPEGFELAERPEIYRVEDSYINMKGKRLDPLKTEEVRLVIKPTVQGVFPLKPTILYLDEDGKYKSHESEPIPITVRELGISGWIKGPKKTK